MKNNLSRHGFIFTGYFLLSVFNTYPLIFSLNSKILNYTDFPWQHDWWFNAWLICHGPRIFKQLTAGSFFLDDVFYPLGIPISPYVQSFFATCVSQPLLVLFTLPVTMNLLTLISLSACGYTTFLMGRHILKSDLYGIIMGFIYCSSPIIIAQAKSHLVLLTTIFAIPLYLLYLIKITRNPNLKNAALLSLSVFILASGYLPYLNLLFIFTLTYVSYHLLKGGIHLKQIKYYLISLIFFLPLFLPILAVLLKTCPSLMQTGLSQVRSESVDLLALFLPNSDSTLSGQLVKGLRASFLNNPVLQSDYIGISILILSSYALINKSKGLKFWIVSAVLFTLLCLGPVLHISGKPYPVHFPPESGYLPYTLYYFIFNPLIISDCSMAFIIAMLIWSFLATCGIKSYFEVSHRNFKSYRLAAVLFLIIADFIGIPQNLLRLPDSMPYDTLIHDKNNFSVLHLPYRNDMIAYLYDQCLIGKPMLNSGYPRRLCADYYHYGDNFPVFALLKNPDKISSANSSGLPPAAAHDFQWFFNLKYIVIHKNYLKPGESTEAYRNVIITAFDTAVDYEDGSLLIFKLKTSADIIAQKSPCTINFDADDTNAIFLGWSFPEKDATGMTWRWSDCSQSILVIKTESPEDTLMRCNLSPFIYDPKTRQALDISLNDTHLGNFVLPENWNEITYRIPASNFVNGYNRFVFTYRYTASPLQNKLGDDPRQLGVAFDAIHFIPF